MLRSIRSLFIVASVLVPAGAPGLEITISKDDLGQLSLQLLGDIKDDDDVKFQSALIDAVRRGQQISYVSIYSPGGQSLPAMQIGRYVRNMHLTTVAPQLVPLLRRHVCTIQTVHGRTTVDYDPQTKLGDPRCTCAGECFIIWAAGSMRQGDAVQLNLSTLPEADMGSNTVLESYLRDMGIPETTIRRLWAKTANEALYLTAGERGLLIGTRSQPRVKQLVDARCHHHAATSPAAIACERTVIRELYWRGAEQLLNQAK